MASNDGSDRPNILVIMTDQHRLSAVGCYGPTVCRTPHIDRLAAEGVRFGRAYTPCPVCSPARASLMTGVYPFAHGVCSNVETLGCSVQALADRPTLLSRRLEAAGYRLGYTGKWHLCAEQDELFDAAAPRTLPRDVGFDGHNFPGQGNGGYGYEQVQQHAQRLGCGDALRLEHDPQTGVRYGEWAGPIEGTVDYFLAQHSIDRMRAYSREGQPFFLWHNFWGPHAPHVAPTEYLERYRDVAIEPWANFHWPSRETPGPHRLKTAPGHDGTEWHRWEHMLRHYYAFTEFIDDQIGRIISAMRDQGLLDNTIVVFTADHGETLGSHGGLTDKGFTHFEETQRIPLIVRFPDGRWAGTVRDELVSLIDLYPTLCDWGGAEVDAQRLHGQSLMRCLEAPESWRDEAVVEFDALNGTACTMRTLRVGDLKYGYTAGGRDELYDLEHDPHETRNLIDDAAYRDRLDQMRERLRDWMKQRGDPAIARMQNQFTACRGPTPHPSM